MGYQLQYLDVFILSSSAVLHTGDAHLLTIFSSETKFYWRKKKSADRIYICGLSTANYSPYFHLAISVTRDFSFNVFLNDGLFLVEFQLLVWDHAARQTHISSVRLPCFDPYVNI